MPPSSSHMPIVMHHRCDPACVLDNIALGLRRSTASPSIAIIRQPVEVNTDQQSWPCTSYYCPRLSALFTTQRAFVTDSGHHLSSVSADHDESLFSSMVNLRSCRFWATYNCAIYPRSMAVVSQNDPKRSTATAKHQHSSSILSPLAQEHLAPAPCITHR